MTKEQLIKILLTRYEQLGSLNIRTEDVMKIREKSEKADVIQNLIWALTD